MPPKTHLLILCVLGGAIHAAEPPVTTLGKAARLIVATALDQDSPKTRKKPILGCRDNIKPHHHLARTFISRDAVWITHMSEIAKTTKSQKIAELKTPLDPESWHTLTIEIVGDHYRARVGEHVVEAKQPRFADTKALIALITKGQGAQFKNIALWHSKPK